MDVSNYQHEVNRLKESKYCNLKLLAESLNSCLLDGDDIHLGHYLDAYKELKKFCLLMGSVFGFVANEIEHKTGILEEFRKKDECGNFVTMNNMIHCEKQGSQNYFYGCRTLLLLNRGLNFLRTFLMSVSELRPDESTSYIAKQAYDDTLANHHVWYVRAGARLAMLTMPSKQNLLNYVLGDTQNCMIQYLPEVLTAASKVYDRTYTALKNHRLLELA